MTTTTNILGITILLVLGFALVLDKHYRKNHPNVVDTSLPLTIFSITFAVPVLGALIFLQ